MAAVSVAMGVDPWPMLTAADPDVPLIWQSVLRAAAKLQGDLDKQRAVLQSNSIWQALK